MINTAITEQLLEYPPLIRRLELEHFEYLQEKRELEERIDLFNAELEMEIANDLSLRNEQMRKASRLFCGKLPTKNATYQKVISQKVSGDYQQMSEALLTLQGRIARSLSLLECRKREFSVLKLERRLEIAINELG